MLDVFKDFYYYLDLLVGFSAPVLFFLLYKSGRIDRFLWRFFWVGVLIGMLWEAPIFVLSGESTSLPIIIWNRPLIAHYLVFMIAHSLWDGLLFAIGVWLVYGLCRGPYFQGFRLRELMVLVVWGQVSELLVELSSTMNDGWSYIEYSWNPVMFHFNGHNITALMQVVWGVAPVLFYFLLLRFRSRYS